MASSKLAQTIVRNRKRNMSERMKDAERYSSLDTDKDVQKRFRDYEKIIGPKSTRWSKEDWYDLNYGNYISRLPKTLKEYATRSKRMTEM